jgi:hypothetical protein
MDGRRAPDRRDRGRHRGQGDTVGQGGGPSGDVGRGRRELVEGGAHDLDVGGDVVVRCTASVELGMDSVKPPRERVVTDIKPRGGRDGRGTVLDRRLVGRRLKGGHTG